MGMVAARLSDVVVITSDNPRSEDPAAIIDEIKRGIPAGEAAASGRVPDVMAIVDRAEAIERAVSGAPGRRRGARRRQGPREDAAHRRPGAGLRRRRSVARGAGTPESEPGELTMQLAARHLHRGGSRPGPWPAAQVAGAPDRALGAGGRSTRACWRPARCSSRITAARDGHEFVPAAIARGAAGVVVARPVAVPAGGGRSGDRRGRRHAARAAGSGAGGAPRLGRPGRRHHRQRRQDHHQGRHRRRARRALPRRQEPRQPQQPPRPADLRSSNCAPRPTWR